MELTTDSEAEGLTLMDTDNGKGQDTNSEPEVANTNFHETILHS